MIVTPRVRGAGHAVRWLVSGAITFWVGSVVAATCLGAVLGFIGALAGAEAWGLLGLVVIVLLYVNHQVGLSGWRVPSTCWQVPQEWAWAGRMRFSLVFGLLLGLGLVTIVKSWGIYVVVGGAFAQGDVLSGASIVGMFGLARGMPMILMSLGFRRGTRVAGGDAEIRRNLARLAGPSAVIGAIESGMVGMVGGGAVRLLVG